MQIQASVFPDGQGVDIVEFQTFRRRREVPMQRTEAFQIVTAIRTRRRMIPCDVVESTCANIGCAMSMLVSDIFRVGNPFGDMGGWNIGILVPVQSLARRDAACRADFRFAVLFRTRPQEFCAVFDSVGANA